MFEAIRGPTFKSDIAIDDFSIRQGPCQSAGNCDFETGMCGFTNDRADQFDWTRANGATPTLVTGPHNDHTTNSPTGLSSSACFMSSA